MISELVRMEWIYWHGTRLAFGTEMNPQGRIYDLPPYDRVSWLLTEIRRRWSGERDPLKTQAPWKEDSQPAVGSSAMAIQIDPSESAGIMSEEECSEFWDYTFQALSTDQKSNESSVEYSSQSVLERKAATAVAIVTATTIQRQELVAKTN